MNPDATQISLITPTHASADQRLDVISASVTVALHVLLIAIMLHPAMQNSSLARSSGRQAAMQVSLVTEQNVPTPQTPPQPLETPEYLRPVDTVPTPVQVTQAASKPMESKAASKSASSSSAAAPSDKPANDSQELADVIGRIRDNWLEPPGSLFFRCRLRIDYAVGGKITAVNFIKGGCGALALDDSVRRAIWKVQSLPLSNAKHAAGSLEIDFTP